MNSEPERCILCYEESPNLIPRSNYFGCKCKAYFHSECWKKYLEKSNKCPFCKKRAGFTRDQVMASLAFIMWCIFICTFLGILEYKIIPINKKIFMQVIVEYFL